MVEFNSYVALTASLLVAVGVISSLVPPELEQTVGRAAAAVCVLAIIAPVIGSLGSLPEISLPELGVGDLPAGGYAEVTHEAFCCGVESAVAERLGVGEDCVSVEVGELVTESLRAADMTVTLSGEAAIADARELRIWLEEALVTEGGICKVVIKLE